MGSSERRLLLLRHAKTERTSPQGDHGRRLTERGLRDGALIARHMAERGLVPDFALVSDAVRAKETFERAVREWEHPPAVRFEAGLYLAEPEELLAAIAAAPPGAQALLVVAHNPGIADLAFDLARAGSGRGASPVTEFPTGALAVFSASAPDWAGFEGAGARLAHFVTPKKLRPPEPDDD